MPTYDYKCPKCGHRFEVFQKISAKPGAPCPKCGAAAERQMSGSYGVVFKGSGFYETDYKRPSEKAKRSKPEGTGGSKPATPSKTETPKSDSKAD